MKGSKVASLLALLGMRKNRRCLNELHTRLDVYLLHRRGGLSSHVPMLLDVILDLQFHFITFWFVSREVCGTSLLGDI